MKALIVVDIQNDFLPGGPLGVPGGDELVAAANRLIEQSDLAVATQDWHPADHYSFDKNHEGGSAGETVEVSGLPQILWPVHCLQGTAGAEFASGLHSDAFEAIFRKGTDPMVDSYSGFFDNGRRKSTGLAGYLRGKNVDAVVVCGLATDYCVKFTALDAVEAGFQVTLAQHACRGVNLVDGDVAKAVSEMAQAGIEIQNA